MGHRHIYLDVTQISIVVKCADCDHWAALAFTRVEAWTVAAAHETHAHPGRTQARDALATARKRAALPV